MLSNPTEIEAKWQEKWYSSKINEANRDGRKKFMIIFAYPGVTGYLHVGHMRGFSYVDDISRYMRMRGYNVMFPVGTHATGNGPISLAKKVRAGDENTISYLLRNGCPKERLEELKDPVGVVEFFNQVYVEQYWRRFGFMADWRRFACTVHEEYGKFIQWQFRKLMEAGLLIQKPYYAPACVNCGPVAIDASETDISCGGNAETTEYTLMKFRCDDLILLAATLRPETVFGQTNFWVNPEVEYVKVKVGEEIWVMSRPCLDKMRYQKEGLTEVGTIHGRDLIGKFCTAPMTGRRIPCLPASFCDPNVGTGLVVSVPSDAPDDWVALMMLQRDEELCRKYGLDVDMVRAIVPIAIIDTKGWGPMPAVEIVERMGITTSGDPRLIEAKKIVYKEGFHAGRMNSNCGRYSNLPVDKAKEMMKEDMLRASEADLFYDLSEKVVCRCGEPVVIKKVTDQWFIDYANEDLTARSKEHAKKMLIMPTDYMTNIQGVLDWFRERACVRQGNWLGTRFPFDEKWIIEAISDSTLYPIYYTVSLYVNNGSLKAENMTTEFFDHVFLGKGDIEEVVNATKLERSLIEKIKADVDYWYPLDVNLGGKEHMTVHFPAFVKNHVAILPEEKLPRGIFVNWYVISKAGKISKSKGGAQPIPGAAEKYGVDALRLYYAHIASPFADVEWDEEVIENYVSKVEKVMRTVEELSSIRSMGPASGIDMWLLSRLNSRLERVISAMSQFDLKTLANEAYFEIPNDLRWYVRRGGGNAETISKALSVWVRMMAPITPHIAEEMWEHLGNRGFVTDASFPEPDTSLCSLRSEIAEDYLRALMDDINEILKVTKIAPKRVLIYTTPSWKEKGMVMALELAEKGELKVPTLTKAMMQDEHIKKHGKEASDYARKTAEDLLKRSKVELDKLKSVFDELEFIRSALPFLIKEFGCEVAVFNADDPQRPDPQNKARMAQPRRPAIYVE
ncbi:MAG: leucine--tRNA ligase [Methanomassiliicoccales archaeon]|nr:MAG: leucine--tRNA ligase [Methanomassiliicoccales archaeon]